MSYQFPPLVSQQLHSYSVHPETNSTSWLALHLSCLFSHLDTSDIIIVAEFMDTICGCRMEFFFVALFIISLAKTVDVSFAVVSKRTTNEATVKGGLTGQCNTWLKVEVTTLRALCDVTMALSPSGTFFFL